MMVVGGNTHFASGRWRKRRCLCLPMNRNGRNPPPAPPVEGSRTPEFPSWEGSGVGSGKRFPITRLRGLSRRKREWFVALPPEPAAAQAGTLAPPGRFFLIVDLSANVDHRCVRDAAAVDRGLCRGTQILQVVGGASVPACATPVGRENGSRACGCASRDACATRAIWLGS